MVHTLFISSKIAQQLIDEGCVEVDGKLIYANCFIDDHSEIKVNGKIERERTALIYLLFNKPVGFESTLNTGIEKNLSSFFNDYNNLAIAGRLDKQSEGLLILSNDGKWVEELCNPKFEKEKEYLVTLNKDPDEIFLSAFQQGVKIGTYLTKPCFCKQIGANLINVILTEGKNRQIRKMCKTLGFEVTKLQRIRIDHFELKDLKPGQFRKIQKTEL